MALIPPEKTEISLDSNKLNRRMIVLKSSMRTITALCALFFNQRKGIMNGVNKN